MSEPVVLRRLEGWSLQEVSVLARRRLGGVSAVRRLKTGAIDHLIAYHEKTPSTSCNMATVNEPFYVRYYSGHSGRFGKYP